MGIWWRLGREILLNGGDKESVSVAGVLGEDAAEESICREALLPLSEEEELRECVSCVEGSGVS